MTPEAWLLLALTLTAGLGASAAWRALAYRPPHPLGIPPQRGRVSQPRRRRS